MAATLTSPPAAAPPAPVPAGPARRRAPRTSTLVAWSLTTLGVVLLSFVGFLLLGSQVQADRAQGLLYSRIVDQLADATAPVSGVIEPGTPIGVLEVPRLGLRQAVVQGSSSEQTVDGPGLKSDSAFPGQPGVSVIVGRRATYGAPFADLGSLRRGDRITVVTGLGRMQYVVDLVRRTNDPEQTIEQVPSRLTLVTSDPAFTPTRQIVVSAALDGEAVPASTTPTARDGERPGEHTLDQAVLVLLWTQALLLVVWLITRAALRFGAAAVWIGGVPVVLAVLWNLFEGIALLLPNTL